MQRPTVTWSTSVLVCGAMQRPNNCYDQPSLAWLAWQHMDEPQSLVWNILIASKLQWAECMFQLEGPTPDLCTKFRLNPSTIFWDIVLYILFGLTSQWWRITLKIPVAGSESGSSPKSNQLVLVTQRTRTQNFIQIHPQLFEILACRQTDRQMKNHSEWQPGKTAQSRMALSGAHTSARWDSLRFLSQWWAGSEPKSNPLVLVTYLIHPPCFVITRPHFFEI